MMMNSKSSLGGFIPLTVLLATACNPSTANEQALATIDGSEITHREVLENLEITASAPTRRADPAKLQMTLETLVQRRILAQEAKRQGLEKDATFHFAMRRAEEILLIEALQRNVAKAMRKPDPAEISAYIQRQPSRFDHRYRLLLADGGTQSELDSFTLPPGNDVAALAKVGDEIVIEGRKWTVVRRFEDPINALDARRLALDEMVQRHVQNSLAGLESKRRSNGVVRYRTGWGPSAL